MRSRDRVLRDEFLAVWGRLPACRPEVGWKARTTRESGSCRRRMDHRQRIDAAGDSRRARAGAAARAL